MAYYKIEKSELLELLNPHLQNIYKFDQNFYEVQKIRPEELFFNTERFDLISKYVFIDYYLNKKSEWGEKVYKEVIKIFSNGTFREGDGLKNKYIDYKNTFISIIQSYLKKQVNRKLTFLPVDFRSKTVIDGAHRLAAGFFFKIEYLEAVNLPKTSVYDYKYFTKKGINIRVADFIAFQYSRLNPKVRIVNLFPIAKGREKEVEKLLLDYGKIFYAKKLKLTIKQAYYLTRIMYKGEKWIGDKTDKYKGAYNRAKKCFSTNEFLRIYVYVPEKEDKLRELKEKIRAIYNIGNEAVHINDNFQETQELIEFYFNQNSQAFYQNRLDVDFDNLEKQLKLLETFIQDNNLDKERFCIDAGGVLAAYGLRENNDLDFFTDYKELDGLPTNLSIHNEYLKHINIALPEILYNPEYHFYYNGFKFLRLDLVKILKQNRGEAKDRKDIRLINSLKNSAIKNKILYYRYNLHKIINPNSFLWKILKAIRFEFKKQYYSQFGQDKFLDQHVFKGKKKGYFIDIGAHNGIKYSNTFFFEKYRKWKGICIEPIPEIFDQLEKNRKCKCINAVVSNKPGKVTFLKISGYSEMLSGIKEFYNQEHLQRIDKELKLYGGKKEELIINALTFDDLMKIAGRNSVDYCSIDVEGAELEILKTIDFKIYNIKAFTIENNYNSDEIRNLMQQNGYIFIRKIGDDDIYLKKEFYERNIKNIGGNRNL